MSILSDVLFALLGLVCGAFAGLPSLAVAAVGPWLAETIVRRPDTPVGQRRRNAAIAVTLLVIAHVVWMWFLSGWVIAWLGLPHPWSLRIGATAGAFAMGGMGWIFLCAALEQMIKEPEPRP